MYSSPGAADESCCDCTHLCCQRCNPDTPQSANYDSSCREKKIIPASLNLAEISWYVSCVRHESTNLWQPSDKEQLALSCGFRDPVFRLSSHAKGCVDLRLLLSPKRESYQWGTGSCSVKSTLTQTDWHHGRLKCRQHVLTLPTSLHHPLPWHRSNSAGRPLFPVTWPLIRGRAWSRSSLCLEKSEP